MLLPHPRQDKNKAKGCHSSCGSHQKTWSKSKGRDKVPMEHEISLIQKRKRWGSMKLMSNVLCLVSFDMLFQLAFPWRWISQQKKHKQAPTSVSLWITSCTVCVCIYIYIWLTSKREDLRHILSAWLHQCGMSHTAISRHKHSTSLGIKWHGLQSLTSRKIINAHQCWDQRLLVAIMSSWPWSNETATIHTIYD